MSTIQENIQLILEHIKTCAQQANRNPNDITLLAVSKTKPTADIYQAYLAGQRQFGESYVQEAVEKINYFRQQNIDDIKWHFIGPIQSNKTKLIAESFDVVQSVDRIKIIKRLNEQRPTNLKPLEVLIQVNISNEPQKSGATFAELDSLIEEVNKSSNLTFKGLMGIAENTQDTHKICEEFLQLNSKFIQLKQQYPQIDTLSLGMSADMEEAILSGSTMVRIGSAIFGTRNYSTNK
ncbi:MAG: YggS family pyridoxal phosphate-dependent enzyme [Succinivibrionaceae bacterium]|nr:YggS family pyridoxal phosphate-dependent enzyme [Succinivibrionaceae bacterium]